jgi:hypothetical protein
MSSPCAVDPEEDITIAFQGELVGIEIQEDVINLPSGIQCECTKDSIYMPISNSVVTT